MSDYDAIVIGAGHNGLTAANVLAKGGARVLVLERAKFVGGMAATRELFDGFKHSVGAWAVLVWPDEMTDKLELGKWGFELVDQWTSACSFGDEGDTPFVMYNDLGRMMRHMLEDHGQETAAGLADLFAHIGKFAPYFQTAKYDQTLDIFDVIAAQPDAQTRHDFVQMWFGSTMDTVRRFLPPESGRCVQGAMAGMSIDGFDGGPWTQGSSASLLYHYLVHGNDMFKYIMPRGGIGALSEALQRRAESMGAEVRLKTDVRSLLVNNHTVTGVVLRDGTEISADVVLSSLDPWTTFIDLAGGEQNLPPDYIRKVKEISFNLGYIQAHLTLDGEPTWIERLRPYTEDNGQLCPTMAYLPSPEYVSDAWDAYRVGKVPERPPAYLYVPSVVDPSLAPEGKHSATIFAPYFPYNLSADDNRVLKETYADTCVDILDRHAPGFAEMVRDRVVFSNRYFNSAFHAHNGDYAHGLLSPTQLWSRRMVPGEDKFATPLQNLYLCGQGTHPGPGVTSLPGWNGGGVALERLNARTHV